MSAHRQVVVKFCGFTNAINASAVAQLGASYIGINCWPGSKRYAARSVAIDICQAVRTRTRPGPRAMTVGLFVDATVEDVAAVASACEFDIVQLHGDESLQYVHRLRAALSGNVRLWRALPVAATFSWQEVSPWFPVVDGIVLDTPSPGKGGSGRVFDWARLQGQPDCQGSPLTVLAGGLHCDNVTQAIAAFVPDVVDVASGVESAPGIKDLALVERFMAAVDAAPRVGFVPS